MESTDQTAFWTAGVRSEDAASAQPLYNDTYAQRFMTDEGRAVYASAAHLDRPRRSLLVRHLLIDRIITQAIERDPATWVVLLGAGFDSRAFRMKGGRWLEIDQAVLLEHKNACLPVDGCPNPLQRLALDVRDPKLADTLHGVLAGGQVLMVLEGLLMYMEASDVRTLLAALGRAAPQHQLVCDLMASRFIEKYAGELKQIFAQMGAPFRFIHAEPQRFVEDAGYRALESRSVVGTASEMGLLKTPPPLLRKLLTPGLFEGSSVCRFQRD